MPGDLQAQPGRVEVVGEVIDPVPGTCDVCGEEFPSQYLLEQHVGETRHVSMDQHVRDGVILGNQDHLIGPYADGCYEVQLEGDVNRVERHVSAEHDDAAHPWAPFPAAPDPATD